jgi:predicted lactoylglutathione lyase
MADLVTVQDYKDAEGLTGAKDDDRLNILVPQISELVKRYCGTSFVDYYSTDKTEVVNITENTSIIIVSESPLVSVTSVKERTGPTEAYTTLVVNQDYYVDTTFDAVRRVTGNGSKSFQKGFGAVEIKYRSGYSAVPSDLKLAVHDLITYYLRDEHKSRRTIQGATLEQQGSSSVRNNTDFPDHIKRVLDLYRVVV